MEAIRGNGKEEALFKEQIPGMLRSVLPMVKKRYYNPMTVCLSE